MFCEYMSLRIWDTWMHSENVDPNVSFDLITVLEVFLGDGRK